jgi:hypothetical protein
MTPKLQSHPTYVRLGDASVGWALRLTGAILVWLVNLLHRQNRGQDDAWSYDVLPVTGGGNVPLSAVDGEYRLEQSSRWGCEGVRRLLALGQCGGDALPPGGFCYFVEEVAGLFGYFKLLAEEDGERVGEAEGVGVVGTVFLCDQVVCLAHARGA